MFDQQLTFADMIRAGRYPMNSIDQPTTNKGLDPWLQLMTVITNPILIEQLKNCEFVSLANHVLIIKANDEASHQWICEHCKWIIKAVLRGLINDPKLKIRLIRANNGR